MTGNDLAARREAMVEQQIRGRGVRSPAVLDAMRRVRREAFVPDELRDRAYDDAPLPIAAGQTISQPLVVATMTEALELSGGERVLDVGTGSGYAAAVLACIAGQVYSVERIEALATRAQAALLAEGFANVHVRVGDGSLGWPEAAPFDAIVVAAGAPAVPEALKRQLAVGGRLVLPVGPGRTEQQLLRVTRIDDEKFKTENLGDVRFVPLLGAAGWAVPGPRPSRPTRGDERLVRRVAEAAQPFASVDELPLEALLERVADSRLVLLGEASHGTSEFYRARQRITRALIEEKGFDFVAIEGDWPDVAQIDRYVRHAGQPPSQWTAFAHFPTWMWRNQEVHGFVEWLRAHNAARDPGARVALHGLDLYSLEQSIAEVLDYLEDVDPAAAAVARGRYDGLAAFASDPADYGRSARRPGFASCEAAVADVLADLLARQQAYAEHGRERFLDAVQNARLVVSAEAYYRLLDDPAHNSWNLRDTHMFQTLEALLAHHGEGSRGVVWAHNSHLGDARATSVSRHGEINLGQLCRERFGHAAYLIGFGTHTGTVAAASDWGAPMQVMTLRPALPGSYERLCHETGHAGFLLPLGRAADAAVRKGLSRPRLQRAIGVIYRPDTERASHYFEAELPRQFDEYVWVDHSHAVTVLDSRELAGMPDTYPFGL